MENGKHQLEFCMASLDKLWVLLVSFDHKSAVISLLFFGYHVPHVILLT